MSTTYKSRDRQRAPAPSKPSRRIAPTSDSEDGDWWEESSTSLSSPPTTQKTYRPPNQPSPVGLGVNLPPSRSRTPSSEGLKVDTSFRRPQPQKKNLLRSNTNALAALNGESEGSRGRTKEANSTSRTSARNPYTQASRTKAQEVRDSGIFSPASANVPIGMSIPEDEAHSLSPQTAGTEIRYKNGLQPNNKPITPTITLTPTHDVSPPRKVWSPLDEEVNNRSYFSPDSDTRTTMGYGNRRYTAASRASFTDFEDDDSPEIMRANAVPFGRERPGSTDTMATVATLRRSQGWWNHHITTPFLTRSNTFAGQNPNIPTTPEVPDANEMRRRLDALKTNPEYPDSVYSPTTPRTTTTMAPESPWPDVPSPALQDKRHKVQTSTSTIPVAASVAAGIGSPGMSDIASPDASQISRGSGGEQDAPGAAPVGIPSSMPIPQQDTVREMNPAMPEAAAPPLTQTIVHEYRYPAGMTGPPPLPQSVAPAGLAAPFIPPAAPTTDNAPPPPTSEADKPLTLKELKEQEKVEKYAKKLAQKRDKEDQKKAKKLQETEPDTVPLVASNASNRPYGDDPPNQFDEGNHPGQFERARQPPFLALPSGQNARAYQNGLDPNGAISPGSRDFEKNQAKKMGGALVLGAVGGVVADRAVDHYQHRNDQPGAQGLNIPNLGDNGNGNQGQFAAVGGASGFPDRSQPSNNQSMFNSQGPMNAVAENAGDQNQELAVGSLPSLTNTGKVTKAPLIMAASSSSQPPTTNTANETLSSNNPFNAFANSNTGLPSNARDAGGSTRPQSSNLSPNPVTNAKLGAFGWFPQPATAAPNASKAQGVQPSPPMNGGRMPLPVSNGLPQPIIGGGMRSSEAQNIPSNPSIPSNRMPQPMFFGAPNQQQFSNIPLSSQTPPVFTTSDSKPVPVSGEHYGLPPRELTKAQKKAAKAEAKKQQKEKDSGTVTVKAKARDCSGLKGPLGKKKRNLYLILTAVFLLLLILIITLAMTLTRKTNKVTQPSQWLNLTGFPPIFLGVSTVIAPTNIETNTGCVFPATQWSCDLPKELQPSVSPNKANQPNLFFYVQWDNSSTANSTFSNVTNNKNIVTRAGNPVLAGQLVKRLLVKARAVVTFITIPAPPTFAEEFFLGNSTDGIVSPNKAGEPTPFFISMLSSADASTASLKKRDSSIDLSGRSLLDKRVTLEDQFPNITSIIPAPSLNSNGTASAANLLPSPLPLQQPIRLYDRGLPTEHYGFYTYFDRSIFLQSTDLQNTTSGPVTADQNGGSSEGTAKFRCTWAQTRFLIQIWTRMNSTRLNGAPVNTFAGPSSTTSSANLTNSQPGTFPYPITITTDRHGGNVEKKIIYCYAMDGSQGLVKGSGKLSLENRAFGGSAINPAPSLFGNSSSSAELGGFDGGSGGCGCQWSNFGSVTGA